MIRGRALTVKLALRKGFSQNGRRPSTTVAAPELAKYSYECSSFADIESDRTMIEKSLRNGLQSVVTRSKENIIQIYELLFDLSAMEDCEMKSLYLGHIFSLPPAPAQASDSATPEKWFEEVDEINKLLNMSKKRLNFMNIPLQPNKEHWNHEALAESMELLLAAESDKPQYGTSRTGLDINTSLLANATSEDIELLISSVLEPLAEAGHLQVLTVASNPLTHHHAYALMQWAAMQNELKKADIHLIATEVLRCHSRRPGLLTSGYPQAIPHRMSGKTIDAPVADAAASALLASKSPEVQARMRSVEIAVSDFQMALDRCIHTEKLFLSKVTTEHSSAVAVTDVCMAHVLMRTHAQFQYPEEWQFVHTHQIEPKLARGLQVLTEKGPEMKDWATLYQPMSKYLVSSFRHLLQEKALLQSLEAAELLEKALSSSAGRTDSATSVGGVSGLPEALGKFTGHWTGAHCVALSQVQVDAAKWLGRKTGSFGSLSTARAREINTKLRRLLVEGDH